MKNIIKVSSLGLVALLASCGGKTVTFNVISPEAAIRIANSIGIERDVQAMTLFNKDETAEDITLYTDSLMPFSTKRISADTKIQSSLTTINTEGDGSAWEYEDTYGVTQTTTINKHLFIDIDNLYCHCHLSVQTVTGDDAKTYNYPDVDYYAFFIENEEQSEELESELAKMGNCYVLQNVGDIKKTMFVTYEFKKEEFIDEILIGYLDLFKSHNDEVFVDADGHFDVNEVLDFESEAAGFDVSSFIPNLAMTNALASGPFRNASADATLFMTDWVDNFSNIASTCETNRLGFVDNEKGSYFNYVLKSADAQSLSLETELFVNADEDLAEGYKSYDRSAQAMSFVIKDLYLTESHLTTSRYMETVNDDGVDGDDYRLVNANTTFDQTVSYSPSDKVSIPADYLDYIQDLS